MYISHSLKFVVLCYYGASLVAQRWRICLQCRRPGPDPWVGKIPWRRKWRPTLVFLPGQFPGQRSLAGFQSLKVGLFLKLTCECNALGCIWKDSFLLKLYCFLWTWNKGLPSEYFAKVEVLRGKCTGVFSLLWCILDSLGGEMDRNATKQVQQVWMVEFRWYMGSASLCVWKFL